MKYTYRILAILSALFSGLVLTSCATKVYTPPMSSEGMRCVQQCLSNKQVCDSNYQNATATANLAESYERQLQQQNKSYVPRYINRPSYNCESNYDQCYRSCGGNIKWVENKS